MKKTTFTFPVLLTAVALSTPAFASDDDRYCQSTPNATPMALSAFFTQLEKDGYRVKEFEHKRNCYKIEGTDAQGQRIEAYFDFGNGKLVHSKRDW